VADSLVVVVGVDLFFSFASFGLSEPYWYFLGALSVVTARLAVKLATVTTSDAASQRSGAPTQSIGGRVRALPRSAVSGGRTQ
jgi:hypothetical protein